MTRFDRGLSLNSGSVNVPVSFLVAVKRAVFVRDGGCCSYVDERGVRCGENRYLELHHLQPHAQGGRHVAANLTLRP